MPHLLLTLTIRDQILAPLANPNLALALLFAGVLLIALEFNRPGAILPGAIGTTATFTALYALAQLPIRPSALVLILTALTLLVLDLKLTSHGILTAIGTVALSLGTLTLINSTLPSQQVNPVVALAFGVSLGALTAILMRLALRARRQKILTGPAALVGFPATTMEPVGFHQSSPGHILVQGEIWQATSATPIPARQSVKVTGHQGTLLEVTTANPDHESLTTNH